jgi:hypothetical protein
MVRRLAHVPPAELRPRAEATNGAISQNSTIQTRLRIDPGANGIRPVPKP